MLLLPTGIKLIHAFEHHHDDSCSVAHGKENLHKCEFDCSFLKYNLQQYYIATNNFSLIDYPEDNFEIQSVIYHFYRDSQHLSFSLRAPPVLA